MAAALNLLEAEGLTVAPLVLDGPRVWLPIRHQSPACAWHVRRVIQTVRPRWVLIEGPRDANDLLELLLDPETRPPVAIHSACSIERERGPSHYAAYYPLSEYSPELVALQTAAAVGAEARLIDLSLPETAHLDEEAELEPLTNLQSDAALRRGALLEAACRRTRTRDPDDLWDHCFEASFRTRDSQQFFDGVMLYCALARHSSPAGPLSLAREAAMAEAVAAVEGTAVVVTGGFHTVALREGQWSPRALPEAPEASPPALIRWSYGRLDRFRGYESGMPCPGFYEWLWRGGTHAEIAELFVAFARFARRERVVSAADLVAATDHVTRLAALRGHAQITREDFLDGVRSVMVPGSLDVEGAWYIGAVQAFFASGAIGRVPPSAGRPPIVGDFESTCAALGIATDTTENKTITLDLYRSQRHRQISRFMRRLALLGIPFSERERGPDFVTGEQTDRIREVWTYRWKPEVETQLLEAARYGGQILEAAQARLLELFAAAEQQDARSAIAARLLVESFRCGLHARLAQIFERTAEIIADDPDFSSLTDACEQLVLLVTASEPLEAHDQSQLWQMATAAWHNAAALVPALAQVSDALEEERLSSLTAWWRLAADLDTRGTSRARELAVEELLDLLELRDDSDINPVMAGAACGLLYSAGQMRTEELTERLGQALDGAQRDASEGARFVRGLLRTARSVCWQVEPFVATLHAVITAASEDRFMHMLPNLRLAFADLTPRETEQVAERAAGHCGAAVASIAVVRDDVPAETAAAGARIDAMTRELLAGNGLAASFEASDGS